MIPPRAPSIRAVKYGVDYGEVSVPTIEPREHAAWMQRMIDLATEQAATIAALNARVAALEAVIKTNP